MQLIATHVTNKQTMIKKFQVIMNEGGNALGKYMMAAMPFDSVRMHQCSQHICQSTLVSLDVLVVNTPQVELDYLTQSTRQSAKRSGGFAGLLARYLS